MLHRVILESDWLVTGQFNNNYLCYRVRTGSQPVEILVECQSGSGCHRSIINLVYPGKNQIWVFIFK